MYEVTVAVPAPLRRLTGGKPEVRATGENIRGLLDGLEAAHPGFAARLLDEQGRVRTFLNVYVRGEDIRGLQGMDTPLRAGDEVIIVSALAGG